MGDLTILICLNPKSEIDGNDGSCAPEDIVATLAVRGLLCLVIST